jgi:hypothetical protein
LLTYCNKVQVPVTALAIKHMEVKPVLVRAK